MNEDYTALYLPARPEGSADPSQSGFPTSEAAWDYVYSRMCRSCREERARALSGAGRPETEDDPGDSEAPACSCEWVVLKTADLNASESMDDVFLAAGFKKIWPNGAA